MLLQNYKTSGPQVAPNWRINECINELKNQSQLTELMPLVKNWRTAKSCKNDYSEVCEIGTRRSNLNMPGHRDWCPAVNCHAECTRLC